LRHLYFMILEQAGASSRAFVLLACPLFYQTYYQVGDWDSFFMGEVCERKTLWKVERLSK